MIALKLPTLLALTVPVIISVTFISKPNSSLESLNNETQAQPREISTALSKFSPLTLAPLSEEQQHSVARYLLTLEASEPGERPWRCFHPDTDPSLVTAFHEAERLGDMSAPNEADDLNTPQRAFQFLGPGRWGRTALSGFVSEQGSPITITWSIPPDGTQIPNGNFENSPSDLRDKLSSIYGGSATGAPEDQPWFPLFQQAFDDLEAECGITFVYEDDDDGRQMSSTFRGRPDVRGDIRLAGTFIDGNSNTLAFAFQPNFGDVVFDTGDDFFEDTSQDSRLFHNVLTHEVGHALGLAHVCPITQTKLMEPFISRRFRGAQFDDSYSLQRQYGDPSETNNGSNQNDSPDSASEIEIIRGTTFSDSKLSIDDNSDSDVFAFDALQNELLSTSVDPSAFGQAPYAEGPQNGDQCGNGTLFDPNTIHPLRYQLLASDGETILAQSASGVAGARQAIRDYIFPEDGRYFLRVDGGTANSAQLYVLRAQITQANNLLSASDPDFSAWAERFQISDANSDPDGDGLSNIGEYLLGQDPNTPSPSPSVEFRENRFRFLTGRLPSRPDASLGIERSPDLRTWQSISPTFTLEGIEISADAPILFYRLTFESDFP